jgi:CRP-like cAMP-binding protein
MNEDSKHPEKLASSPESATILSPAKLLPERAGSFDPHLVLTKLSAGKTTQAYLAGESVFIQGDAADAVFYIQSGKVKLTVVS